MPIAERAAGPDASNASDDGAAAGASRRLAGAPRDEESGALGEPADEIAHGFATPAARRRLSARSAAEPADREDDVRSDGAESLRRLARRITVAACAGFTLLVAGAGAITEHQLGSYEQRPTAPRGVEQGDDADSPSDRYDTRPRPGQERGLSGAGVSPLSRATRRTGPGDRALHDASPADQSARARRPLRPGQAGRAPSPAGPRSSPSPGPQVRPRTHGPYHRPDGGRGQGHGHARSGHEHEHGRPVSPAVRTAPRHGSRRSA